MEEFNIGGGTKKNEIYDVVKILCFGQWQSPICKRNLHTYCEVYQKGVRNEKEQEDIQTILLHHNEKNFSWIIFYFNGNKTYYIVVTLNVLI